MHARRHAHAHAPVDSAEAGAGQHGVDGLGDHGHVQRDHVVLADPHAAQRVRHLARLFGVGRKQANARQCFCQKHSVRFVRKEGKFVDAKKCYSAGAGELRASVAPPPTHSKEKGSKPSSRKDKKGAKEKGTG